MKYNYTQIRMIQDHEQVAGQSVIRQKIGETDVKTVIVRFMRDFMLALSDNNQTDITEAFNSTSRYLDDLLYIDNPYFEQMVGQIYPT